MNSCIKSLRVLVLVIGCLFWSSYVHSDWSTIGAAAKCAEGESLTVVAVEWGSTDSNPAPKDYKQLKGKAALSCKVGTAKVTAVIQVSPPADRGMGKGSGYVSIDNLEVNGVPIFGRPTAFNWQIPGSDLALIKATVFLKDNVPVVEACNTEKCYQESLVHDVLLNLKFQELVAALPEHDRERLRQEQRFWLKERDPQCRYSVLRVENEPLAFLKCVMSATNIRTLRLMDLKLEHQRRK